MRSGFSTHVCLAGDQAINLAQLIIPLTIPLGFARFDRRASAMKRADANCHQWSSSAQDGCYRRNGQTNRSNGSSISAEQEGQANSSFATICIGTFPISPL
jgi:hypothetical protein